MPKEILLPAVATDFESGAIEEWLKDVGDTVEVGDLLIEVSTDKAVVEVEAEFAGTLGKILIEAGSADVEVNTPIAIMLLDGEGMDALDSWTPSVDNDLAAKTEPNSESAPAVVMEKEVAVSGSKHRLYASPIARRIAAKAGVDVSTIKGTGPRGRVVLGDVEAAAAKQGINVRVLASAPAVTAPESLPEGSYTAKPADNIRQVIARRLTEAKRDIPHFYLTVDCRLDRLLDARQQLNEFVEPGERVSVNDFFIKACAFALNEVPDANVSWSGDAILHYNDINISIAVASPKGLMTPVLRNADAKSLVAISSELEDIAARARAGKLKPDEFKGGCFTVSNLGMYGIREFAAIINPPQACILAIGAGEQRAIVRDGQIAVATMASCTLSVDHRAVDGALGSEFLAAVKKYIERPAKLLS